MKITFQNLLTFLFMMRCGNGRLLLYFVFVFQIGNDSLIAQSKVLTSAECEVDYAFGGGKYGLFVKANHQWTKWVKLQIHSGVSTAFFAESNSLTTDIYERRGVLFDPHLYINSGILFSVIKEKLDVGLDLFSGFYSLRRQGHYNSSVLNFTQDRYIEQKAYFNWGTRLVIAYYFRERTGLQISANHSFNEWMVFRGADYSKMFFGLGVIWKISNERSEQSNITTASK